MEDDDDVPALVCNIAVVWSSLYIVFSCFFLWTGHICVWLQRITFCCRLTGCEFFWRFGRRSAYKSPAAWQHSCSGALAVVFITFQESCKGFFCILPRIQRLLKTHSSVYFRWVGWEFCLGVGKWGCRCLHSIFAKFWFGKWGWRCPHSTLGHSEAAEGGAKKETWGESAERGGAESREDS